MNEGKEKLIKELKSWIIIVVAFVISLGINTYVVQPCSVVMTSMYDTLTPNDQVLVDKISYKLHQPRRGDVVVFLLTNDPTDKYIKRVIGLPNETIAIMSNKVYIDGKVLYEPYVYSPMLSDFQPTKIPEGYVFLMGDNRSMSIDSRTFGSVSLSKLIGKAIFVYWPLNHIEGLTAYSGETP